MLYDMALPNEIVQHIPELRSLAVRYGLRSVAIIGSAASGSFDPSRSDLDLLVDFGEYSNGLARRALGFYRDAQRLFGRRVDVVSVQGIKSQTWREIHDSMKVPVYVAA
jgi:predicted nucleotidyltransferase